MARHARQRHPALARLGEWENWTERQGLRSTLVWDTLRISPQRTLVANDDAVMALDRGARAMVPWPSEATTLKQVSTLAGTPDGAVRRPRMRAW